MTTNINLNPIGFLPNDIYTLIFKDLSLELDKVALVCKEWQTAADSQTLRAMIRPLRTMGLKELKTVNPSIIDAGIELPLPRCAYRHFSEKGGLLFFNPGKVKLKNVDGEIKVELNSLDAIGNLFKEPITDLKTVFNDVSWSKALKEERIVEKPHWGWINIKVLGLDKTYAEQLGIAKEEDKKAYPERYEPTAQASRHMTEGLKQIINLAGVNDLVLGMLMAFAILKERHFISDSSTHQHTFIRVKDTTKDYQNIEKQLIASFHSYGIYVDGHDNNYVSKYTGIVCERKSFGF